MPERIVTFNEAKIDKIAKKDFWWGATPCDLEGDDYRVHEWLTYKVTTDDNDGIVSIEVIDCDRKDEK